MASIFAVQTLCCPLRTPADARPLDRAGWGWPRARRPLSIYSYSGTLQGLGQGRLLVELFFDSIKQLNLQVVQAVDSLEFGHGAGERVFVLLVKRRQKTVQEGSLAGRGERRIDCGINRYLALRPDQVLNGRVGEKKCTLDARRHSPALNRYSLTLKRRVLSDDSLLAACS